MVLAGFGINQVVFNWGLYSSAPTKFHYPSQNSTQLWLFQICLGGSVGPPLFQSAIPTTLAGIPTDLIAFTKNMDNPVQDAYPAFIV